MLLLLLSFCFAFNYELSNVRITDVFCTTAWNFFARGFLSPPTMIGKLPTKVMSVAAVGSDESFCPKTPPPPPVKKESIRCTTKAHDLLILRSYKAI